MKPALDEGLFEIFSGSFYGYGSYRAPVWFVGPHADFLGRHVSDIAPRLELWHRRAQPPTVDLSRFQSSVGENRWSGEQPGLHRIWSKLARTALSMERRRVDPQVRSFQTEELGRADGRYALLHLLAVDARREAPWPYDALDTGYLRRPDLYAERFTERRARHLVRQVQRYSPALVVFFDLTHRQWWQHIAGVPFEATDLRKCFLARAESTLYLMMLHPESVGTRNTYFERVGTMAAQLMEDSESLPAP